MVKQRFGCIYRLTNMVTNKKYIGKTVEFNKRMWRHQCKRKSLKTYLKNSIRKYGWDAFKKEIIIDNVPEEDLNNLEISYIEVENTVAPNGYNLTVGGEGSSGYKHKKSTIEKMRKIQRNLAANREKVGTVYKRENKWCAGAASKYKPGNKNINGKYIGIYNSKEKAQKALQHYNETGEILESDMSRRKSGTGQLFFVKSLQKYRAVFSKKGRKRCKLCNTTEEAEEFLSKCLEHFNLTGNIDYDRKRMRKRGTGSIRPTPGGRYRGCFYYNRKNQRRINVSKVFDTVEECETWLKSTYKYPYKVL